MNLLVTPAVWQNSAQNHARKTPAFSARSVWRSIAFMAGASSKAPACTSQYRYPSPLRRLGFFWTEPPFFRQQRDQFGQRTAETQQRTAENCKDNSNVSAARQALLGIALIKAIIRGTNQCRSNTWPLWPRLSRRWPVVWTMMSNGPEPVRLRALLSWGPLAAVCSPVRLSVLALVRCATISVFATNLIQNNRTHIRPNTTTHETATAGIAPRWFFIARLLGNAPAGHL